MKRITTFLLAGVTALFSFAGSASTGCDCTKLLDQCGASIRSAGSDIQITTNTRRCAQVSWYADDALHNSVVVNGKINESANAGARPALYVGSCKICASKHPETAQNRPSKNESAECKKRRDNLKISEKYYAAGRITPYEYELSKKLVKQHCE